MDTPAQIYHAYIDAETRRDPEGMRALLGAGIAIEIDGAPALAGVDQDAAAIAAIFEAYPDYHREIIEIIEEGNRAAARWRMLGHPRPELAERLPVIDFKGVSVVSVEDGRMTEAYVWSSGGVLDEVLSLLS